MSKCYWVMTLYRLGAADPHNMWSPMLMLWNGMHVSSKQFLSLGFHSFFLGIRICYSAYNVIRRLSFLPCRLALFSLRETFHSSASPLAQPDPGFHPCAANAKWLTPPLGKVGARWRWVAGEWHLTHEPLLVLPALCKLSVTLMCRKALILTPPLRSVAYLALS